MVSQAKLIKQGIYLTDSLFDEIIKRLNKGVKSSDTLEAFLNKTKDYTMNNPLVFTGYKDELLEIILKETNNHKFSRPAQKELTRLTIENRVGDLIVDVGEDVKNNVRDIVKHGYNNGLSQDEIAENISHRLTTIKNTRARTIARTEIARTATASDYVINKERGATHFTVDCRDTCCDICRKDYNFGKVEYTIDQVEMLPPRHPNCRCYTLFFIKEGYTPEDNTQPTTNTTVVEEPTDEQLKSNLNQGEYMEYTRTLPRDIENYKTSITDTFKDDDALVELFSKKLEDAIARLEELRQKALSEKQEPTFSVDSISSVQNFTLNTMMKETPLNQPTFNNMCNWADKRLKNKNEYGYQFDTETGEFVNKEIRGKKGRVSFQDMGENIGSIHTHPPEQDSVGGGSFPSAQDIKAYRGQRGKDHYILSPNEVWYIHAEEQLGMGSVTFGQREINAIYKQVYEEVTVKGQELVKQGELKTDDASLRVFMEKEIGDGLLKAFDTQEWRDKGLIVRRAYR